MIFIGGLLILFQAYSDFTANGLEDVLIEVERLLETPNSQSETPITPEQYQQFHDDAKGFRWLFDQIYWIIYFRKFSFIWLRQFVQTAQFWTKIATLEQVLALFRDYMAAI